MLTIKLQLDQLHLNILPWGRLLLKDHVNFIMQAEGNVEKKMLHMHFN